MDKEKLKELVTAAQNHDDDAFGQLYTSYYKSLYRTAYYLLGNAADAEDTVMDTVTDAYTGIGKLRVAEAFEGWIYKILYNKARRKRGIKVYKATVELPETLEGSSLSAESIGDNADLMRALDTLSEQERSIVVLSVCEGYTSAEIGQIMALNANTVRSKQMRALAKMRTLMEPTSFGKEEQS